MNRKHFFVSLFVVLAITLTFTIVSAQGPKPTPPKPKAPIANAGTAFTYQGQLKKNSALVNDNGCAMTFSLWDSQSNLTGQVGGNQTINPIVVSNGLFTVVLNSGNEFGANAFDGSDRWLQIAVQCTGDGSSSMLTPRQPLTSAPYALGLRLPASEVISTTSTALAIFNNGIGDGVMGLSFSSSKSGVIGSNSSGGYGVSGDNGNSNTSGYAGYFTGRVQVTQDLTVLGKSIDTGGLQVASDGTKFTRIQAGTATVGSNGVSGSIVFTVTFPSAFSGIPKLIATTRNNPAAPDEPDTFVVSTRNISSAQVVFNIVRVDTPSPWAQSLLLDWFAWE